MPRIRLLSNNTGSTLCVYYIFTIWFAKWESNPQHLVSKTNALTVELLARVCVSYIRCGTSKLFHTLLRYKMQHTVCLLATAYLTVFQDCPPTCYGERPIKLFVALICNIRTIGSFRRITRKLPLVYPDVCWLVCKSQNHYSFYFGHLVISLYPCHRTSTQLSVFRTFVKIPSP